VKADINVTPLVDVVLVLLIIFMVVTPLIHDQVRLPSTAHPALRPSPKEKLLLTLEKDGTLRIDGKVVTGPEVKARLVEAFTRSPATVVAVKADASLRYGDVKSALMTVRDAGFDHAGLITKPDAPAGGTIGSDPPSGPAR
jgi:biopolymer transport protein ExbD